MSGVRDFTNLLIWKKSREWSREIFWRTKEGTFAKDQRLTVQINDSSESVMSNIAEGFGRGTQEEFVIFLGYAIGSLMETQSHLTAAYDRKYLAKDEFGRFYAAGTELRKMIVEFIRSMIMPRSGVRNMRTAKTWSERVREIYERVIGEPPPPIPSAAGKRNPGGPSSTPE
ncbi:MAG TPA: four helix bundle protein [Pirellulaceae bacterium]|jgi:four helix bundle protein